MWSGLLSVTVLLGRSKLNGAIDWATIKNRAHLRQLDGLQTRLENVLVKVKAPIKIENIRK